MKILIPVDPEIPVPPKLYGGVERLVDGLINAYVERGHEVVLLAHAESTNPKAKRYAWKNTSSRGLRNTLQNAFTLLRVYHLEKPDVIHSFGRLMYLYPTLMTSKVGFLMTYGRFISPKSTGLMSFLFGKRANFTAAAGHMLNHLQHYQHKFTPVYNFTLTDYFVPDDTVAKEHVMFLGRIEDIKGTKECIASALATHTKLIIAGNIQPGHDAYFAEHIKPHLEHPLIEYVGPVDDEQKKYYLQRSKAFLFPIKWEEPFGIVMAEAMACGTPVIAFKRGSVPEVVKDGETGYIVNDVPGMIDAIEKVDEIDRTVVRQDCEQRFSLAVIAEQYLDLLAQIKL
ncbi:glycosyltransferase [Phaeodactylibacter luteus]|uniref:Glycosyltransferase family 4 protein n=1 Tax=Phaeodactylibacter luteus TaxID=1564516 RepID=A0A5C6RPB1_9BACT|nr:glycosyltransferase [Phaeodactylibacter luteus]TXB63809.1 glycosyltransferase family 4 protein [Phaeodactylibacter luteus]